MGQRQPVVDLELERVRGPVQLEGSCLVARLDARLLGGDGCMRQARWVHLATRGSYSGSPELAPILQTLARAPRISNVAPISGEVDYAHGTALRPCCPHSTGLMAEDRQAAR